MKKLMIIFGLLFLVGCGGNQSGVIKLGVISPMTGDFGTYGQDVQRGISIALEELDNVEVLYEDACLPKESLTAINKLVNADKVDMITGVFCIVSVEPIATLSEPQNMNVMMVAAVPDNIIDTGKNVFSANIAVKTEAKAQAEVAFNELGARTAGILFIETPFGISYEEHFKKRFTELGGDVLSSESLDVYAGEFRTPLTKLKEKNPDVALIVQLGKEMGLVLKQAKELGLASKMMGTYEAEDPTILEVAGDAAEGFIISSPITATKNEKQRNFEKRYREKYGEFPTVVAVNSFDGIMLQVNAFNECNGDRECIRDFISNVKDYNGVSGTFSIGEDGTAIKEITFKEVKNGEFVGR